MTTRGASAAPPVVETGAGAGRGVAHAGGAAYFGIPFAAPPVGPRRFLAPQPPQRWEGVRLLDAYGPTPQRRPFGPVTTVPEPSIPGDDTLSVSVFTPAAGDRDAALPVLAWIHGGAYFAGSPASPWYDGRSFSRDGVVTVVLSYRLGFDGYGWIDGAPSNRGVLDQLAALRWIQEQVRDFGGDPSRVTVAGQSAGGGSVLTLLASPAARGLFRGAISQSGAVSGLGLDEARGVGERFAASLGVAPTLDGWRSVSEDRILDAQRDHNRVPSALPMSASPDRLLAALRRDPTASLGFAFAPVVDGRVVDAVPDAVATGVGADVPLLLGANGSDVVGGDRGDAGLDEVVGALRAAGADTDALRSFVRAVDRLGGARYAKGQLLSSWLFRAQNLLFARLRAGAGAGDRTWLYDFVHRSAVTGAAGHCDELPFVWDLLDAEGVRQELGDAPPQQLADRMHADWVHFVETGRMDWSPVARTGNGARVYGGPADHDERAYRLEAQLLDLR